MTSNVIGHGKYYIFNTTKPFWMTLMVIFEGLLSKFVENRLKEDVKEGKRMD